MPIYISKIIVLFAFSLFLAHDVMPHFHFNDYAQHSNEHNQLDTETDHIVLEHQIDENFTVSKVLKINTLTVLFKEFYNIDQLKIILSIEEFTVPDFSISYNSNYTFCQLQDRAPPRF